LSLSERRPVKRFFLSHPLYRSNFHFLLGFSASHVLPGNVTQFILGFLDRLFLSQWDIFESFKAAATADDVVASSTPINLIFRDQGNVRSLRLVISRHQTPWGLTGRCGNPACRDPPDVQTKFRRWSRGGDDWAKAVCRHCNWWSKWVPRPDWVEHLGEKYFIHEFPLDEDQEGFLTTIEPCPSN
jgi:hypothetical protein